MRYEKTAFKGVEVVLDGNEYEHCSFDSCTFVYSGGESRFGFNRVSPDCNFLFRGAAGNTVRTMQAIYRDFGEWGKRQIISTFEQIAPGSTRH